MVYVNQIHLIKKGAKKNKKFLRLLYNNAELEKVCRWFDKKFGSSASIAGQSDKDMTLDKFLKGINSKSFTVLQLASPDPFDIRYCAVFRDYSKKIKRFAWITCPYSDYNFNIISKLYEESFGSNLEDEPVLEGLLEYYEKRFNLGY